MIRETYFTSRASLQLDSFSQIRSDRYSGKLGKEKADTLTRLSEIKGELLLIFGSLDPHIPEDGRITIKETLEKEKIRHKIREYEANHSS